MKKAVAFASALIGIVACFVIGCGPSVAQEPGGPAASEKPKRVEKTDAEWAKLLSRDEFLVTRRKATEPAFTGRYARFRGKVGIFACVCCGTELFDAKNKFESGTGWPSFYQPIAQDRIATEPDYTMAEPRTEVMCSVCDAHLGHVFNDGPRPTGLRFCINSAALKLVKPPAPASKGKAASKGKVPTPKGEPVEKPKAE